MAKKSSPSEIEPAPMSPIVTECYNEVARKYKSNNKTKKKVKQLLRDLNELWNEDIYRQEAEGYIADVREALDQPGILHKTVTSIRKALRAKFN